MCEAFFGGVSLFFLGYFLSFLKRLLDQITSTSSSLGWAIFKGLWDS